MDPAAQFGYARAVQFHPHGGQFDLARSPTRTPHGAYVWVSRRNQEKAPHPWYFTAVCVARPSLDVDFHPILREPTSLAQILTVRYQPRMAAPAPPSTRPRAPARARPHDGHASILYPRCRSSWYTPRAVQLRDIDPLMTAAMGPLHAPTRRPCLYTWGAIRFQTFGYPRDRAMGRTCRQAGEIKEAPTQNKFTLFFCSEQERDTSKQDEPWMPLKRVPGTRREPVNSAPMAVNSISLGSPHARCTPVGVHRTRGGPNETKKNTHPRHFTALFRVRHCVLLPLRDRGPRHGPLALLLTHARHTRLPRPGVRVAR